LEVKIDFIVTTTFFSIFVLLSYKFDEEKIILAISMNRISQLSIKILPKNFTYFEKTWYVTKL